MIPYKTEKEEENTERPSCLVFSLFYFWLAVWILLDGIPAHEKRAYDTTLYDEFIDDVMTMRQHSQKTWIYLYLLFILAYLYIMRNNTWISSRDSMHI